MERLTVVGFGLVHLVSGRRLHAPWRSCPKQQRSHRDARLAHHPFIGLRYLGCCEVVSLERDRMLHYLHTELQLQLEPALCQLACTKYVGCRAFTFLGCCGPCVPLAQCHVPDRLKERLSTTAQAPAKVAGRHARTTRCATAMRPWARRSEYTWDAA